MNKAEEQEVKDLMNLCRKAGYYEGRLSMWKTVWFNCVIWFILGLCQGILIGGWIK